MCGVAMCSENQDQVLAMTRIPASNVCALVADGKSYCLSYCRLDFEQGPASRSSAIRVDVTCVLSSMSSQCAATRYSRIRPSMTRVGVCEAYHAVWAIARMHRKQSFPRHEPLSRQPREASPL